MRTKNVKLEWYVLRHDFNSKKIVKYNIFGVSFIENLYKDVRKGNVKSKEDLKEYIRIWAQYHYWCKAEHEMLVGDLFSSIDELEKIDVFRQIDINLDRIVDYVNKECVMSL